MQPTTYTLKFGTLQITEQMFSRDQRREIYTNRDGETFSELCFVIDENDNSPRTVAYDRDDQNYRHYNPACSCCYLGLTHSTNYHDRYTE